MKVKFEIDKYLLVSYFLSTRANLRNEWEELRCDIANNSSIELAFLSNNLLKYFAVSGNKKLNKISGKTIINAFKKLFNNKEIKKLIEETTIYKLKLEKEWDDNYEETRDIIKEITKIEIPDVEIKVFVVHPELRGGHSFPKYKKIVWGHKSDWPYYNIVYLWHEIFHCLTYGKYKNKGLTHALIELVNDNELRARLNKEKNDGETGHLGLKELRMKILPDFKKFIKDKKIDLFIFEKQLIKKLPKRMIDFD